MAKENGNVSDLTIEVLKGIRTDLQGLRGDVKETNGRLDRLGEKVDRVAEKVEQLGEKVEQLGEKVEQLSEFTQTGFKALLTQGDRRFLDHEGRLRRLEEHAGIDPTR